MEDTKMDLNGKLIVRNNSIETAEMGAEVGMLDVESGNYFMLNEIGTEIWNFLEGPMIFEQLIDELQIVYDIDRKTCENEALEFINQMVENQLIQVVN